MSSILAGRYGGSQEGVDKLGGKKGLVFVLYSGERRMELVRGGVVDTGTEFEGFRREMGTRRLSGGVKAGGVCSSKRAAEVSEMEGVCVKNTSGQRLGAPWKGMGCVAGWRVGKMFVGVVGKV